MPDLAALVSVSLALILVAGANARFAKVVSKEKPAAWLRRRVKNKTGYDSLWVELIECPWCVGFWTALPATALAWFPVLGLRLWWLFVPAWFAVAHATGRWNTIHSNITGK